MSDFARDIVTTLLPADKTADVLPYDNPSTQWGKADANAVFQALRDMRAALRGDVFNVKNYGAKGTGLVDDTAAIQAAIAAASVVASSGEYGAIVYLPRGTYLISAPLLLPNGVGLRGDSPTATVIRAAGTGRASVFSGDSAVANLTQDGTQEFCFVERLQILNEAGATQTTALLSFYSLFINSWIRDVVVVGGSNYGLYVAATSAMGPIIVHNTWSLSNGNHGVMVEERAGNTQACNGIWLSHVTSEHPPSNKAGIYLKGRGHSMGWALSNIHCENSIGPTGRDCVVIDGVSRVTLDCAQFLQGAVGGAANGVRITNDASNVGIQLRNISNANLIANIIKNDLDGTTWGAINVDEYNTSDVVVLGSKKFRPAASGKSIVIQDSGATDRLWIDANGRLSGNGAFGGAVEVVALPQGTPGASDDRGLIITDHSATKAYGMYYPNGGGGVIRERMISAGSDVRQIGTDGSEFHYAAQTFQLGVTFQSAFLSTARVAPAALSSNQNDYAPGVGNKRKLIISASSPINITGIAGGVDGAELFVYNSGTTNTITLTNDDAASTEGNRIYCRGNANFALAARTGVVLIYDGTLARWLMQ